MKRFGYILIFALMLVSCLGARLIPRDDLAKIYAEMLVVDQWVKNDRTRSRIADTSYVYASILEKYGYTMADYRKSVVRYMDDPERFAQVFEKTEAILNYHLDLLALEDKLTATLDSIRRVKREREFPRVRMSEGQKLPYISDSLAFSIDSAGMIHLSFAVADTMFSGPFMVINDSILRRDSIFSFLRDSLLAEEVDSARLESLLDSIMAVYYPVDTIQAPAPDSLLSEKPLPAEDTVRRPFHLSDSAAREMKENLRDAHPIDSPALEKEKL